MRHFFFSISRGHRLWMLLVLLLCSCFLPIAPAAAEIRERSERQIHIGYDAKLEAAVPYGPLLLSYAREYLDEICNQTGYSYSFLPVNPAEYRDRLADHQIDLMLPIDIMPGDEGKLSISSGYPCYTVIGIYAGSGSKLIPNDPHSMTGANIGIIDGAEYEIQLSHFLADNGLTGNLIPYQDSESQLAALHGGEIDGILATSATVTDQEQLILPLFAVSASIVGRSEDAELMARINDTITDIEYHSPDFETRLETQYLDPAMHMFLGYTAQERRFIEQAPTFRIVCTHLLPPLLGTDASGSVHGIYSDIIHLVARESGLSFQFVEASSDTEAVRMLQNGEADFYLHIYDPDNFSQPMLTTQSLFQERYSFIVRQGETPDLQRATVAIMSGNAEARSLWQKQHSHWKFIEQEDISDCLGLVEDGYADFALLPSLPLGFKGSLPLHPALAMLPDSHAEVPVRLIFDSSQPRILQSILNKAILHIEQGQIFAIIQQHSNPSLSVVHMVLHYPAYAAICVAGALLALFSVIIVLYRNRLHRQRNAQLAEKNKELADALQSLQNAQLARDSYKFVAETDTLTGILNKAALEAICRAAFLNEVPSGKSCTLFIIDLDHFKEANDTFGHEFGDEILRRFASSLRRVFRQTDTIGRWGGDEFIVFLKELDNCDVIARLAEKILANARTLAPEKPEIPLSASIGIAIAPNHGISYEQIFFSADHALYHVKECGRDGFAIFDPAFTEK